MKNTSAKLIKKYIKPLSFRLYRVVESQEEVATTVITSSKQDQSLLEELLETSKPKLEASLTKRHYLISTPFRYPPLRHGSRFGSILEAGIFYGSLELKTALAEIAYYRFRFLTDLENSDTIIKHKPQSNHTGFYVNTHSEKGLTLLEKPFTKMNLDDGDNYLSSQPFGKTMREADVELFKFSSARLEGGINGAAFTQKAIKSSKPSGMEYWQCLMLDERIVFRKTLSKESLEFSRESFYCDGVFPVIY